VPWEGLRGLAPALAAPLGDVLAGAAAERVLDRFLRARRDLAAVGRAAVAEAVFGVGLWRRRLAWHAGEDAPPLRLLAALLRDLALRDDAGGLCEPGAVGLPPPRPPPPDLATFYSLPDWLAGAIAREAGDEAPLLADALCLPGPVFLRVNRRRARRDEVADRLLAAGVATCPGRLAPDALEVAGPSPNLLGLDVVREGLVEVQDEGSQLLGEAAGAMPGDAVLDACAGAGGKTLQLAAAVGTSGLVHACDPDAGRLDRLRVRAERAGARVSVHGAAPPEGLVVDRVLVDAPCSELGARRRGPDVRFRVDPATFAALPPLQLGILSRAARHVRPGGRLVYATCTFRREENAEVALAFERDHPGFQRAHALPGLSGPRGFLETWPHRHGTDAFFAAAWTRR
jgi:16S rRNA (cytosine967-C5)-methyltransferase